MTNERREEIRQKARAEAERIVSNAECATQYEFRQDDDYRGTIVLNVEAGLVRFAESLLSGGADSAHVHRWVGRGEYGSAEHGYMCADCGIDKDDAADSGTPAEATPEEFPVHDYVVSICDQCIRLEGECCNNPRCRFCRRSMTEVGEYLDVLLIRPLIDGVRFDEEYAKSMRVIAGAAPPAASPQPPLADDERLAIRKACFRDITRLIEHSIEDCPTPEGKDALRIVGAAMVNQGVEGFGEIILAASGSGTAATGQPAAKEGK